MSNLWDGETLTDWIGGRLERKGFAPFGIGVPGTATRAVIDYLCDFDGAVAVATALSMDVGEVHDVLTATADYIRESIS